MENAPFAGGEDGAEARDGIVEVTDELCPATRIIGRVTGRTCGSPANWTATNLFEAGSPHLAGSGIDFTPPFPQPVTELGKYCMYEWSNPNRQPNTTDLDTLEGNLLEPSRDCLALRAFGDPLNEIIGPTLQEIWRDQVGMVTSSEVLVNGASSESERALVRVSVLDTFPTHRPLDPTYPHGEQLAKMIEDLACPEGPDEGCAVQVEPILAMPRVHGAVKNYQDGGFAGTFGDLAAALMEAHIRWQQAGGTQKHYINMSLGWDDVAFAQAGPNAEANIDAIHTALQYLVCNGATIVAAGGNDDQVGCSTGAPHPAQWQTEQAPTQARCEQLGVTGPQPTGTRPLVYAVAGLRHNGELMTPSRSLGLPRLAAAADHAIGGDPTVEDALTGSSVAAAVATAAAALASSYASDRTPQQIMASVYQGGLLLDETATMYISAQAPAVRQIDICGALTDACAASAECPNFDDATQCVPGAVTGPGLDAIGDSFGGTPWAPARPYLGVVDECDPVEESICGAETEATMPGTAAQGDIDGDGDLDACEKTFRSPIIRMVDPQPPAAACPPCTLTVGDKKLHATLAKEYDPAHVTNVTIHLYDQLGKEYMIDLGDPPLSTEETITIAVDDPTMPQDVVKGTVTVRMGPVQPVNELIIVP